MTLSWWDETVPCLHKTYLFFPSTGEDVTPATTICKGCHVRQECLEHALAANERFGVWGGMSAKQRRLEKRRRRQEALLISTGIDLPLLEDEWEDDQDDFDESFECA